MHLNQLISAAAKIKTLKNSRRQKRENIISSIEIQLKQNTK